MKQKRFIAWMLMVVSMVMLTASVLPHHHHHEILCLQHDIAPHECGHQEEGTSHTHSEKGCCSHGTQGCQAGCVTKFQVVSPEKAQDSVSPDYTFYSQLYTFSELLFLSCFLSETKDNSVSFYLEKLHATGFLPVTGLRAPPTVLA